MSLLILNTSGCSGAHSTSTSAEPFAASMIGTLSPDPPSPIPPDSPSSIADPAPTTSIEFLTFTPTNPLPTGDETHLSRTGRIVFQAARKDGINIFMMEGDGSHPVQLTNCVQTCSRPVWSPNGTKIAFDMYTSAGSLDVYVMNADGSNIVQLTHDPDDEWAPAWSPDGSKIAFIHKRDGQKADMYFMNSDGTDPAALISAIYGDVSDRWSPDGSRILFEQDNQVYVIDIDGSNKIQLTQPERGGGGLPSWSPDGTRIAYSVYEGDDAGLYVENADGSAHQQLYKGSVGSSSWSPDGKQLAFVLVDSQNMGNIYVVNLDGTGLTRLSRWSNSPDWLTH